MSCWLPLVVLLASACSAVPEPPPKQTSEKDPRVTNVLDSADFAVRVHDFDWELGGSTVYAIDGAGSMVHVQPRADGGSTRWLRTRGRVSDAQLVALRASIEASGFTRLGLVYREPNLADGAITTFSLTSGGRQMRVYCQNRYPRAARALLARMRGLASEMHVEGNPIVLEGEQIPGMNWEGATPRVTRTLLER